MTTMEKAQAALPHWDLSNVYSSLEAEAFQRDVDELNRQLDELDAFLNEHQIARGQAPVAAPALQAAVEGYLARTNTVLELSGTLGAYARSFVTTDSYNTAARRWLSRLDQSSVRLRQQGTRFDGWLGDNAAGLPALLGQPGPARAHAFFLRETAEQSRYLMSEAEESLAAHN
jgi:oligoendopeptidase F